MVARIGAPVLLIALPQGIWSLAHAGAWQQVLAGLGFRRSSLSLFAVTLGTEAVRMTLPAGQAIAETLSVWLLKVRYAVDFGENVAAIATKKLLVLVTNAIYAALALALLITDRHSVELGGLGRTGLWWVLGGSIVALLVLTGVMVTAMSSGGLATRFGRLVAWVPVRGARDWADSKRDLWLYTDAQLAQPLARDRLGQLVWPGILLLGQWLLEAAETWLILYLVGAKIGVIPALSIEVCVAMLRSAAFVVPGGLGVQDAGYVALLTAFGVPDPASTGAAFVILKRGKELLWIAVGYLILAAWGVTPRLSRNTS
jgi:uncharacterized membrane protein YbhN (UPF0104 family)